MTIDQARLILQRESGGLVEISKVSFASDLAAIVCAVRPPPREALDANGLARFNCRINRAMWEAMKVLLDAEFARKVN